MKLNRFLLKFTAIFIVVISQFCFAQTAPSPQQIEQFKSLPKEQQIELARKMGFDLSVLARGETDFEEENKGEPDFVQRQLDNEKVSEELSKQSSVEPLVKKLKPFGYDIFANREGATIPSSYTPVPSNYIIGPGDSVKMQLLGKESNSYELIVNNEGNINIPELGPLNVAGVTFQELKKLVNQKYDKQKIGVSPFVSMGELRSLQIFLVGEVVRPGSLTVTGHSTITTALINSGGINEIGSLREIQLKRNGKLLANFDLYDLILKGDTSNDVRLEQGDVLFVPTAKNVVSINGQVRRPAIFEMLTGETFSDLLQFAGGFLPAADSQSIQLIRRAVGENLTVLNLDYSDNKYTKTKIINGDHVNVTKASQEFSNAIAVNGAINLPSILASNDITLSELITKDTIMSNTDLQYGLLLRKGRFDSHSKVYQFKPLDVLENRFDLKLQIFDELFIFAKDTSSDKSYNASRNESSEQKQNKMMKIEKEGLHSTIGNSFAIDRLGLDSGEDFSRKKLLAPVIARLINESSNKRMAQLVEVVGEVKYPGIYPLTDNPSLQSVIASAGGLTESAHLESAEITSTEINDGILNVQHKSVNVINQLLLPEQSQVRLKPKDVLNIVRISQWYETNTIELKGEVVFPGVYQISRGETLASVLQRAGGFTDKASINGAIFSREELKKKEKENINKAIEDLRQQIANNNLSNSQFSRSIDYDNAVKVLKDLTDVEPLGRMVIELESIITGDNNLDFELKNGDLLIVPNVTPAISVIGEVFVTTTYLYDKSLEIDDYINLAGGIMEYGDRSKIYIVRANGAVFLPNENFWFDTEDKARLLPGDTIVVPRDVTNYENISLWQGVTQIIYQTTVAIAAISRL